MLYEVITMSVPNLGMLNHYIESDHGGDIIKISEALHEKKIVEIANMIDARRKKLKVVLVAGPSASGKTTFSKRLAVQMAVNGIIPHLISLDDYFVDRDNVITSYSIHYTKLYEKVSIISRQAMVM